MRISQVPPCDYLIVSVPHADPDDPGVSKAPYQAVASVRFVTESCECPSVIEHDDIFHIKVVWKVCDIIFYDPDDVVKLWGASFNADGGQFWSLISLPPATFKGFFYLWQLSQLRLYFGDSMVQEFWRSKFTGGTEFTWEFTGTIEQLLGRKVTESSVVLNWSVGYEITAGVDNEWWPWNGVLHLFFDDYMSNITLNKTISIEYPLPPPPPDFHFYLDLCDIDKEIVTPSEQLEVKLAIENYNTELGPFYVGCFCKGSYQQLWQGTWTGSPAIPTKTLRVTANQLAQEQITESGYLAFTFTVSNIPGNPPPEATADDPEGITGRWTPAALYIDVSVPPGKANLSGRVTDRATGAGIVGAQVTASIYSDITDISGYYSLAGLTPKSYTIKVTATGYDNYSTVKTLLEGDNTLNIEMVAGEPGIGISPWKVVAGVAAIAGVAIIISGAKGGTNGKR